MFTVETNSKGVDEVVFAYNPPTQQYHARLVPRNCLHSAAVLADRDLDHLIARVRMRLGSNSLGYIDPKLIAVTKAWRPTMPPPQPAAAA